MLTILTRVSNSSLPIGCYATSNTVVCVVLVIKVEVVHVMVLKKEEIS